MWHTLIGASPLIDPFLLYALLFVVHMKKETIAAKWHVYHRRNPDKRKISIRKGHANNVETISSSFLQT